MTRTHGAGSARWGLGLDVGGTKTIGGVVNLSTGDILVHRQTATRAERGGEPVLRDTVVLAEELQAVSEERGAAVEAVGIGVAELVDPAGVVRSAHTIAWRGIGIREAFDHIAPAFVESDVRAAALAEARFGAGRPYQIFAYISVGTGISSCLVQDGVPFVGSRGNALVLASAPNTSICEECGSRQDLVLEDVAAGPGLAARYSARVDRHVGSGQEVMAALASGDPDARHVVSTAGEALGNSVGWLVNVLDPDAVVVGGGLGLAGGLYWDRFITSARQHIWSEATRDLPIVTAELGANSACIGASLAASRLVAAS